MIGILTENKIDILGITESWTHAEVGDAEINLMGYQVFRRDRKLDISNKTRGGGVLLYVKENLTAYEIHEFDAQCEALWVGIRNSMGEIIIGVCYKSPKQLTLRLKIYTRVSNITHKKQQLLWATLIMVI